MLTSQLENIYRDHSLSYGAKVAAWWLSQQDYSPAELSDLLHTQPRQARKLVEQLRSKKYLNAATVQKGPTHERSKKDRLDLMVQKGPEPKTEELAGKDFAQRQLSLLFPNSSEKTRSSTPERSSMVIDRMTPEGSHEIYNSLYTTISGNVVDTNINKINKINTLRACDPSTTEEIDPEEVKINSEPKVKYLRNYTKNSRPEKKAYAREMRRHQTPAEAFLWTFLKAKQLGVRFTRQKVIFGYIADFWCPYHRLIIEVDGAYHANRQAEDKLRDHRLAKRAGITTLRFTNDEVLNSCASVLKTIKNWMFDHYNFLSSLFPKLEECDNDDKCEKLVRSKLEQIKHQTSRLASRPNGNINTSVIKHNQHERLTSDNQGFAKSLRVDSKRIPELGWQDLRQTSKLDQHARVDESLCQELLAARSRQSRGGEVWEGMARPAPAPRADIYVPGLGLTEVDLRKDDPAGFPGPSIQERDLSILETIDRIYPPEQAKLLRSRFHFRSGSTTHMVPPIDMDGPELADYLQRALAAIGWQSLPSPDDPQPRTNQSPPDADQDQSLAETEPSEPRLSRKDAVLRDLASIRAKSGRVNRSSDRKIKPVPKKSGIRTKSNSSSTKR